MDKKDIYEHLAHIYLDASSRRKKKNKKVFKRAKHLLFLAIPFFVGLGIFFILVSLKNNALDSQTALFLQTDVAKINFHFDPARREMYSMDLSNINLKRFKTLAFSVKKSDRNRDAALRIEFINNFKEKSEVYIKNLFVKWQEHKISLSDFKRITDWSKMSRLSFIVEEWNTRDKKGVVYIDDIRFLR